MRITRVVNRKEPYDVYIGRPTIWGNPWSHNENSTAPFKVATRNEAVDNYEHWLRTSEVRCGNTVVSQDVIEFLHLMRHQILTCLPELEGYTLGCWCHPARCHGDVLVKLLRERCDNKTA
jgi:hypothetical protein